MQLPACIDFSQTPRGAIRPHGIWFKQSFGAFLLPVVCSEWDSLPASYLLATVFIVLHFISSVFCLGFILQCLS